VRYTRTTSKKAELSPPQHPPQLPLPLKRPTPTPSDVDVGMLVGGDEYGVANAQQVLVRLPFSRLKNLLQLMIPGSIQCPVQSDDRSTTASWNQFHLPVDTIEQDTRTALSTTASLCPAPHPPHPPHLVTPHSPEPSTGEDLGSEYEGLDGPPEAILKETETAENMRMNLVFKRWRNVLTLPRSYSTK